jgi:hypothetical protein
MVRWTGASKHQIRAARFGCALMLSGPPLHNASRSGKQRASIWDPKRLGERGLAHCSRRFGPRSADLRMLNSPGPFLCQQANESTCSSCMTPICRRDFRRKHWSFFGAYVRSNYDGSGFGSSSKSGSWHNAQGLAGQGLLALEVAVSRNESLCRCFDIARDKQCALQHASLLAHSRHPSDKKGQHRGGTLNTQFGSI